MKADPQLLKMVLSSVLQLSYWENKPMSTKEDEFKIRDTKWQGSETRDNLSRDLPIQKALLRQKSNLVGSSFLFKTLLPKPSVI